MGVADLFTSVCSLFHSSSKNQAVASFANDEVGLESRILPVSDRTVSSHSDNSAPSTIYWELNLATILIR